MRKSRTVKIKIDKLLLERGRNKQWLADKTGASYSTIHKLANNKTNSINFELLKSICRHLECSPNHIFDFDFSRYGNRK